MGARHEVWRPAWARRLERDGARVLRPFEAGGRTGVRERGVMGAVPGAVAGAAATGIAGSFAGEAWALVADEARAVSLTSTDDTVLVTVTAGSPGRIDWPDGISTALVPGMAVAAEITVGGEPVSIVVHGCGGSVTLTVQTGIVSGADVALLGHAVLVGDILRMTDPAIGRRGAAWWNKAVRLDQPFSTTFDLRIHSSSAPPADGMAFVVQAVGTGAIGGAGLGIGYAPIANCVALEFDTYRNTETSDPPQHHLALQHELSTHSAPNCLDGPHVPGVTLSDGVTRTFTVDYDGATLQVLMEGGTILSAEVDMAALVGATAGWLGYTASTGLFYSAHDITNWSFTGMLA